MSKTLLAVNTLTMVDSQAYTSHMNLVYRMGRNTSDELICFNGRRVGIDRFRNTAAQIALKQECDYLMFLDDDVLIHANTYEVLKEADKDIVTPLVYIRGYPFEPMMFKSVENPETGEKGLTYFSDWQLKLQPGERLLECAAIGFSCALIKVSLLKKIQPAWFVTNPQFHTEDVYFCVRARQTLNNEVSIFVDTGMHAGHLLDPEIITFETRQGLRLFHETMTEEANELRGDRGSNYLRENIKKLAGVAHDEA